MDMIFADNTWQYLNLESLAGLPNQLTHPQGKVSLQHLVAVLGYPNEMVLNLEFCMTSLAIIHAGDNKPTASRMLPAWKAGGLTFSMNNKLAGPNGPSGDKHHFVIDWQKSNDSFINWQPPQCLVSWILLELSQKS